MVFNKKLLARKEILLQFSCPDACSLAGPTPRVLTFVLPRGSPDPYTTCLRRVRSTSLSRSNSGVLKLKFYISSLLSFLCLCWPSIKDGRIPGSKPTEMMLTFRSR